VFETRDIPFIHYFLDRFPGNKRFTPLAEPIANYIMSHALNSPVVQHATLAISALLASKESFEQPAPDNVCIEFYLEHKQKALQLARNHLENDDIDGSLAVAIACLLLTERGKAAARVHMHGLKSVLQHLQSQLSDGENSDLVPSYWFSWCIGVRFDIGQATLDGDTVFESLPLTEEYEIRNRSWIERICPPGIGAGRIEFIILLTTLRLCLHRTFHLAAIARKYRTSPAYCPADEAKIQRLCLDLERDLDHWMARRMTQQFVFETEYLPGDESVSFLHYPPVPIPTSHNPSLMREYHMAKLYLSFISIPEIGPGPPESGRFHHALEICRGLVNSKPDRRWGPFADSTKLFQLFLCCLAFGGTDYYPEESHGALELILNSPYMEIGLSVEDLFTRWVNHCPGLPPISPEKFPWIGGADRLVRDVFCD
jgi:Fungal specific transcription factor domain